jgi:hypothetical protein
VRNLKTRGVDIASFDAGGPEEEMIAGLGGIGVLIVCCVMDETALATAAKKAGVERYIPCFYASVMPRGVQTLRDNVSSQPLPSPDISRFLPN